MASRVRKPTAVITRQSAQVPGQLFGYSLQAIRLLNLALDASPGTVLSLEVFEDVGAVNDARKTLASQTKSGLETNPVFVMRGAPTERERTPQCQARLHLQAEQLVDHVQTSLLKGFSL